MKSVNWGSLLQAMTDPPDHNTLDTDLLCCVKFDGLLQGQLEAFSAGTEERVLEIDFTTIEEIGEEKISKHRLNAKNLFLERGKTVQQREQKAKEIMGRQEIAGAISDLASLAVQTANFLCVDGALYYFDGVIWRLVNAPLEEVLVLRRVISADVLEQLTKKQLQELVFKIRTEPSIQQEWAELPRHPNLIACRDGVFDLDSNICRTAKPEDYLFSQNDFYTEEIGRGQGKLFEAFLQNCSNGDRAIKQLVLEIIGVAISGYRPRKFFFFLGEPRTGKSQLADLLGLIIGKSAVHGIDTPGGLGERFAMGSMVGKKLCICGDAEDAVMSTKAVAVIKQITGGDPVLIEAKYQQPFSAVCEALLLFCSNHPLRFKHDGGLRDRLITVPFYNPVPPSEAVENYSQMLLDERGYIVGEAIRALHVLKSRRFQFTYVDAEGIEECSDGNSDVSSAISQFSEQCCQFDPEAHVFSRDLYAAYCAYCARRDLLPIGDSAFFWVFSSQHPALERTNLRSGRGFRGVCSHPTFE